MPRTDSDVTESPLLQQPVWLTTIPAWLRHSWDAVLLLALACSIFYTHLDSPLLEPDESRYAEIPRLMLRSGDWITPRLQGKPYNDKPPQVYWLIAGSYAVFGVSIEAARIVPATAGVLTLLVIYLWTRRYLGRSVANTAILILLSMLGYVTMMRMLLLDGVLAFLVIGSLLAGHHALAQRRHQGWWLISAILCGLAVLTKGPVAIVLVTPCLFALRWLDRTTTPMQFRDAVWYGLTVLALAVPWYAVMMLTNEGFGSEHFFRHHIRRFIDPAHHERPFWYYFPALLLELLPWPILLVGLAQRMRSWTGTERFLVFFSALCFVFFSIARAKLPTYLLPMLPTVAVLFGKQLLLFTNSITARSRVRWLILLTSIGMLITAAFRTYGFSWALHEGIPNIDLAVVGLFLLVVIAWIAVERWRSRQDNLHIRLKWGLAVAAAVLATMAISHRVIPDYARLMSVAEPCRRMIELADAEGIPYAAHRNSWDAVSFMLNREELDVFSSRELPQLLAWVNSQRRCMIWMRDEENRVVGFTESLPAGITVEEQLEMGRMQAIILKRIGTDRFISK